MVLLATPKTINLSKLKNDLSKFEGVITYHDLHIWPISTSKSAMSVHLVVKSEFFTDDFVPKIIAKISNFHKIFHITIQLETTKSFDNCKVGCT